MTNLAHPSVLMPFLQEIDAAPRKSLSQNFLIDANIIRKIADLAEIKEGDAVLEIGPGPGALTQELLLRGARVFAVEKDQRFAKHIREWPLKLYEGDFLTFPLEKFVKDAAPLKVVANLPYHIATPILQRLFEHHSLFSSALVMIQREMAERMMAEPNTKEMSSFTVFLKTYCDPSIAFHVSPNCFFPVPKVASTVVRLHFHPPLIENPDPFLAWVRQAFQQRRKMLRSTLQIQGPYAERRPESLSYSEWVSLFQATFHG